MKNNSRSNRQKKQLARAAHFFVHFFAVVLKRLVSSIFNAYFENLITFTKINSL